MRVLVAVDSFKGSLSSLEVGKAVREGIKNLCDEVIVKPIADGGEGSVEALADALGGTYIDAIVQNPLGEKIPARYALAGDLGILEMASASGLTLIEPNLRNPMKTSTYGFGQMILHAIHKGARKFIVGIGGSATNDAGTGMLSALGYEFYDENDNLLEGIGENLIKITRISEANVLPELKECEFLVACDVDNPLFGKNGAAYIYGPQKGADERMVKELDAGLISFASATSEHFSSEFWNFKGAGAAGGLGFGFVSYLNAKLKSGIEIITEEIRLEDEIKKADLVITGEGRMDYQSAMGKTPIGVAKIAKKHNKPVVSIAGCVKEDARICNENGIDAFFSILNEPMTLNEAMDENTTRENIRRVCEQVIRLYKL
ncbi:glycerate kinase [Campylobacter sp. RM16191]|uniref:glycerate kinase family protein n=1 Tax=Campylobacter sp. RM16191 TaxID=1705728 RepID=UPI001472A71A|nr:glycerate kinase [Campylobacter sp. RM16191]